MDDHLPLVNNLIQFPEILLRNSLIQDYDHSQIHKYLHSRNLSVSWFFWILYWSICGSHLCLNTKTSNTNSLIVAKTRISALMLMTSSRLNLWATLHLSKMINVVKDILPSNINDFFYRPFTLLFIVGLKIHHQKVFNLFSIRLLKLDNCYFLDNGIICRQVQPTRLCNSLFLSPLLNSCKTLCLDPHRLYNGPNSVSSTTLSLASNWTWNVDDKSLSVSTQAEHTWDILILVSANT